MRNKYLSFIFVNIFIFFLFVFRSFSLASVLINEFYTPTSSDWVELYNNSDSSVDISGWILDDEGTSTNMLEIPKETTISAKTTVAFNVGNRLNKSGDTVYLKNGEIIIDNYSYEDDPGDDISFGRKPDGNSWHRLQPPTEGESNNDSNIVDPSPSPSPSPNPSPSPSPSPKASPSPSSETSSSSPASSSQSSLDLTAKNQVNEEVVLSKDLDVKEASFTGEVFGASESSQASMSAEEEQKKPFKFSLPLIISLAGILFLGTAAIPVLGPKIKELINKQNILIS